MSILILACLIAMCLPILSVQIPRLHLILRPTRSTAAENRSTIHKRPPPIRRRVRPASPTAATPSHEQLGRREKTDGADSGARSSEEEGFPIQQRPIPTAGVLSVEGKGKGRADGRKAERKPWDRPLLREGRRMGTGWTVTPPTPPKKTGRDMEAKGVAKRLFPFDSDAEYTYSPELSDETSVLDRQGTARPTHTTPHATQDSAHDVVSDAEPPKKKKKKNKPKPSVASAISICVGILAFLLFILAFAILVAHCLAWFLVYKTEARLGEARRGIMQGGEMRLCLCAAS